MKQPFSYLNICLLLLNFNNPALSQKAKDVLKQARSEYALFKELQNSKIYHDVMGELKSSEDITNSLLKALNAENGLDLKLLQLD